MQRTIDRRALLRMASGGAALGACGALFGPGLVRAAKPASASAGDDYRALVCVFLNGGHDAFNALAPSSGPNRAPYVAARGALALDASSLLPLPGAAGELAEYGLHPSLTGLQARFAEGRLALVANVGNLAAPVTKAGYLAGSAALPIGLFSHPSQSAQWKTLGSYSFMGASTGWGGRILDTLAVLNAAAGMPPAISPAGSTPFLVGETVAPFLMGPNGPIGLSGFDDPQGARRLQAVQALLEGPLAHEFERELAQIQTEGLALVEGYSSAVAAQPALTTVFPQTSTAKQLAFVAQAIQVRDAFSIQRQVFFVEVQGWDTHSDQLPEHAARLAELDQALAAFQAALDELGAASVVTTFTASDFGRSLLNNGNGGTNHGWGSHAFVVGGAVAGGAVHGVLPDLTLDGADDTGTGRIIPTTSSAQYAATLAAWMGVPAAELSALLPGLENFGSTDLGFMNG